MFSFFAEAADSTSSHGLTSLLSALTPEKAQRVRHHFDLPDVEILLVAAIRLVHIALYLAAAWAIARLIQKWFPRFRKKLVAHMVELGGGQDLELEKRAATISGILRKTLVVLVWALAVVLSLKEAGIDVRPILAGAGVVGLAVGFGAQNLVQDVISGIFLLLEDQIRVHDVATLNGVSGLVEAINLRTTVLRAQDGSVHVFRNGAITTLANMTHGYSYYVFDIGVAYKEDTDRVLAVLKQIADEMMREEPYSRLILAPLELLGVDKFTDSSVILKARFKTVPVQQWTVGREMNRRIKKRFDELGIELPYPHTSLYFGTESQPIQLQWSEPNREQIKQLVREAVAEQQHPAEPG